MVPRLSRFDKKIGFTPGNPMLEPNTKHTPEHETSGQEGAEIVAERKTAPAPMFCLRYTTSPPFPRTAAEKVQQTAMKARIRCILAEMGSGHARLRSQPGKKMGAETVPAPPCHSPVTVHTGSQGLR